MYLIGYKESQVKRKENVYLFVWNKFMSSKLEDLVKYRLNYYFV